MRVSRRRLYAHQKRCILQLLIAAQRELCALCSLPITEERPANIDHKIPVSVWPQGEAVPSNLQAAHIDCNNVRGSMGLSEFREMVRAGKVELPVPVKPHFVAPPYLSEVIWRGEPRTETRKQKARRLEREITALLRK